ncbi:MAG: hypothetical protein AABZ30_10875 [Myxococcota bacterium]
MTSRRVDIAIACALALVTVYAFPYFAGIQSANELPRLYQTMAVVDRGALDVDQGVRRWGRTADLSRYGGHDFPNKPPGMSLLGVPFYAALKGGYALAGAEPPLRAIMLALRLGCATLPALLFLLLAVPRLLAAFVPSIEARRAALIAYGIGSMALTYGKLLIAHQLAATLVGTSYTLLVLRARGELGPRALAHAGAAAGAAVLADYQTGFLVPLLGIYAVATARPRLRGALLFAVGGLPFALALAAYHRACFGAVFSTGYDHALTPHMAAAHAQGFLGMGAPKLSTLARQLFSPRAGLLALSPMWLLALPGLALLARRREWRPDAALVIAATAVYLWFAASLVFRGGWTVGPRYMTALLPLLVVPLGLALEAARGRGALWAAAAGLALVSIATYALASAVFPHFPDAFASPIFQLAWPLLRDGHAPYSLGTVVGLRGAVSLAPYAAVVAALGAVVAVSGAGSRRRRAATALGAVLVAAVLLAAMFVTTPPLGRRAAKTYRWIESIWQPWP